MARKRGSLTARRQMWRNVFIVLGTLVGIGLIVLLWFGARAHEVTITSVDVSGTHYIDTRAVESLAQEKLDGSYFWFVPKRNSLFYPKGEIERTLKETFLPINILSIDRDGFRGLFISIEERQPIATWCGTSTTTPCYLVDKTGLLFEESTEVLSGTILYRSVPEVSLGSVFLNGDFFELHGFITTLQTTTSYSVQEVLIDEYDDVFVRLREGGELRFVRSDNKEVLLDNIASAFSSTRLQTNEPFEYIDFRFGNKVYVKFINE